MRPAPPSPPHVSVIIPVKDRRALLAAALDGLARQTYQDFEVVVVDDGSTDGSGEEAARWTIAGRPVRVLPGDGGGAVRARQVGVESAAADVLAFTDSDCVPSPRWLELGVAAIDGGADLANGRTVPCRPLRPLERSLGSGLEGLYPTCNMFYRRDAYEKGGGFDGSVADRWGFRPDRRSRGDGFGEDTLLAWRAIRAGGRVEYVPGAVVEHAVFPPDAVELVSRTVRVAAFPAMVKDVPELRDTLLRWRWQLGRRTRVPVYVVCAAALGRRRRIAVAGLVWWAGLRAAELRHAPVRPRNRLLVLPVEMFLDALTASALVVGSIRARSITL